MAAACLGAGTPDAQPDVLARGRRRDHDLRAVLDALLGLAFPRGVDAGRRRARRRAGSLPGVRPRRSRGSRSPRRAPASGNSCRAIRAATSGASRRAGSPSTRGSAPGLGKWSSRDAFVRSFRRSAADARAQRVPESRARDRPRRASRAFVLLLVSVVVAFRRVARSGDPGTAAIGAAGLALVAGVRRQEPRPTISSCGRTRSCSGRSSARASAPRRHGEEATTAVGAERDGFRASRGARILAALARRSRVRRLRARPVGRHRRLAARPRAIHAGPSPADPGGDRLRLLARRRPDGRPQCAARRATASASSRSSARSGSCGSSGCRWSSPGSRCPGSR